ncbi:MAG: pseudouridine synthase [Patescibacteria group bacterium]
MSTIKLQKFIASSGLTSRRKAEELISKGKVFVNKKKAKIGARIDPKLDRVVVNNKEIKNQTEFSYYLINKPVGYVSTTSDELGRKNVLNLIPKISQRVYPVGRLDIDSQGLMLLTNNGDLAQKLTHPSFEIPKTYHVLIIGTPSSKALNHLARGVKLKEGYTQPAEVEILGHEEGNTWLEITIYEGRNKQVRRMLDRVGYPVKKLIREKMGPFDLEMLDGKQFVQIPESEVEKLIKLNLSG